MLPLLLFSICAICSLIPSTDASFVAYPISDFTSGSEGVRLIGETNSQAGKGLAMIGDYNNDGTNDFAVSSSLFAITTGGTLRKQSGLVVIVLGQAGSWIEVDLSTVTSGSTMRRIYGREGNGVGSAVGPAGDVNSDGFADVLIGASSLNYAGRTAAGAVFVLFGMASTNSYTDIDLGSFAASASTGYTIYGPSPMAYLGDGGLVAHAMGDLNGDFIDDFAVSSPFTTSGMVWFIYGSTSASSHVDLLTLGGAGIELRGETNQDRFGFSIDNVGDFNGDGLNDTLIGASRFDPLSRTNAGGAYLIYGSASPVSLDMSTFVTGAAGVRFLGAAASDEAGTSVSGAGDINGDGKMDLLIGAPAADPNSRDNAGKVYAIFGTNIMFDSDFDLKYLSNAGPPGFAIHGAEAYNLMGRSVSRAGDLDQDGIDDYLLGGNGWLYVLYGSLTAPTWNIDLKDYTGKVMFYSGAQLGNTVAGGSDVTGDGIPDFLVGAPSSAVTPEGGGSQRTNAGQAFMIKGPIYPLTSAPTAPPTRRPSRNPTLRPTEVPTFELTVTPTAPTFAPTMDPTWQPTDAPTSDPTAAPTMDPTRQPTDAPTTDPTAAPTMDPTRQPTDAPTSDPTAAPTMDPTRQPTDAPTTDPTLAPTINPTRQPSARPTLESAKSYEIVLGITQDLGNLNMTNYNAQKAAVNLTIQHTVAAEINGVIPDRVTDIVVEEEEEEEGRVAYLRSMAVVSSRVSLKYKLTVYDPVLSAEVLTTQLKAKVQSGDMDNTFRKFAAVFNVTNLESLTFGEPQVTDLNQQEAQQFKDPPNNGEIAGIVVGGFLFFVLLTGGVWFLSKRLVTA